MKIDESYNITFRRGDSDALPFRKSEGEFTRPEELMLTVRQDAYGEVLLRKTVTDFTEGEAVFAFEPEDTEKMDFGTYVYDVQWKDASGRILHIIPPEPTQKLPKFKLTEEAGW